MSNTTLSPKARYEQLLERQKQTTEYWVEMAKDEVADEIFELMEQEGINKAELARRLGKSRAYITKVLQGGENLTIESMVKIGLVLGYKLREGGFYEPMENKRSTSMDVAEIKEQMHSLVSEYTQAKKADVFSLCKLTAVKQSAQHHYDRVLHAANNNGVGASNGIKDEIAA